MQTIRKFCFFSSKRVYYIFRSHLKKILLNCNLEVNIALLIIYFASLFFYLEVIFELEIYFRSYNLKISFL